MKEIWKDVIGYEGYYQVSNLGRFRSLDRKITRSDGMTYLKKGEIKTGTKNKDGYLAIKLCKDGSYKSACIHRLVAEVFVENDDICLKTEVNHIDTNRANNRADNLEWVSHIDNIRHSAKLGSYKTKCGENNARAVYTEEDVIKMRKLYSEGFTVMEIVREFYPELDSIKTRKNKWSRVSDIVKGKTWKNI